MLTLFVQGNLVVNVIKEMAGKSGFDKEMVSNFKIMAQVGFQAISGLTCLNMQTLE